MSSKREGGSSVTLTNHPHYVAFILKSQDAWGPAGMCVPAPQTLTFSEVSILFTWISMDLVSTWVGTESCWGLQFSFSPLLQRNTRLPGLILRTVDLHIAWSPPTFYPNLMSISLKRLPNPLTSPRSHISNCNLILVVITGFSLKQSFLRNKTKQKDTSNMFAILFLAGKGPVKCLSWHS